LAVGGFLTLLSIYAFENLLTQASEEPELQRICDWGGGDDDDDPMLMMMIRFSGVYQYSGCMSSPVPRERVKARVSDLVTDPEIYFLVLKQIRRINQEASCIGLRCSLVRHRKGITHVLERIARTSSCGAFIFKKRKYISGSVTKSEILTFTERECREMECARVSICVWMCV
jgi:hypothetical protein